MRDAWVRATFALALVHGAFIAIVLARPGLVAVVLWYVAPTLIVLAAAILLFVAFLRSWRPHRVPGRGHFAGYAALALVVGSFTVLRTYPSAYDDKPSHVRFRLPLDGPVTVAWGGPTLAVNYHAGMPDQRWAFDLLVTAHGRSFRNDGSRLEDYYAYRRPVLAPADGLVRVVHDDEPDRPIGQRRSLRAAGNHIVLQVAPREFLFIAHLQPGSIVVAPGDRVFAGQIIGHVGSSGNSSEPHVHLHLQDSPTSSLGEGIPFYFHGYRVQGAELLRGMPRGGRARRSRVWPGAFTGDIVEHVAHPSR